jgi:hypothetical protein
MLNCLLEFMQPQCTNSCLLVFCIANCAFDPFNTQFCHFFISNRRLSSALATAPTVTSFTATAAIVRPTTSTAACRVPTITSFLFAYRSRLRSLLSLVGGSNSKTFCLLLTDYFSNRLTTHSSLFIGRAQLA